MTNTYRHRKICKTCQTEFLTYIGTYDECVYCWYDRIYPKVKKKMSRFFTTTSSIKG